MAQLIYPEESYLVQGIYMDVFREICPGIAEELCEEAMVRDFVRKRVRFDRQKAFQVFYKDVQVSLYYPDLIMEDKIILELKSVPKLEPIHVAQLISYLKVTGHKLGILFNFGSDWFDYQRVPNYVSGRISTTPPVVPPIAGDAAWLYPQLIYSAIGSLYEVHRELGPGFLHHVYRRASRVEFDLRRLSAVPIKRVEVVY